ncbi:MAG: protein tyrosine phosphatase, partial [Pseudomonadota bacterium]
MCSLALLQETVEDTGARHIVSLLGDEARVLRPVSIAAENHLWLRMHDISLPLDGYIVPAEEHIANLLY